jgi:hypothetical protein
MRSVSSWIAEIHRHVQVPVVMNLPARLAVERLKRPVDDLHGHAQQPSSVCKNLAATRDDEFSTSTN